MARQGARQGGAAGPLRPARGGAARPHDGNASQRDCDFYAARGAGGCGLVITETCSVDARHGCGDACNLLFDAGDKISGFARMAQASQATGATFAVGIYHPGSQGVPALCGDGMLASPSGQPFKLLNAPTRALLA